MFYFVVTKMYIMVTSQQMCRVTKGLTVVMIETQYAFASVLQSFFIKHV